MSFILDALRKSEIERQRQHGPNIAEFAGARSDGRPPWALAVIGALLAINVGVILFFLFRDAKEAPAPAPGDSSAAASPAPVPAAAPPAAAPVATVEPPVSPAPGTTQQQLAEAIGPLPPGASDPTLVQEPPAATPSVTYENAPPAAGALPTQAAQGMPELSMDLHIYSADRNKRAVFINGRRYAEGATLAEGAIVEEITPEGAVLNYRGHRFLLPRL